MTVDPAGTYLLPRISLGTISCSRQCQSPHRLSMRSSQRQILPGNKQVLDLTRDKQLGIETVLNFRSLRGILWPDCCPCGRKSLSYDHGQICSNKGTVVSRVGR